MRVIVADNELHACEMVIRALHNDGHQVDWAPGPQELEVKLSRHAYDLAFVDLDFGRDKPSGLAALRSLAHRRVEPVIYSADGEENRLLYLLAAFQHYGPAGLITKETTSREIRSLVASRATGLPVTGAASGSRYRPGREVKPWLDRLLPNATDLGVWRQLSFYATRWEIAHAAHVPERTLDAFSVRQIETVQEMERIFLNRPEPPELTPRESQRRPRTPLLARLHAFAVMHAHFFRDPEVDPLVERRSRNPSR